MKVALPVLCVETRISYCRQLNNLCFLYFHHSLCLQLVYVPFGEFSSGTTNRIVSVSYIPAACFLQICLVWFLCQSLIHSDFFHDCHLSSYILCINLLHLSYVRNGSKAREKQKRMSTKASNFSWHSVLHRKKWICEMCK